MTKDLFDCWQLLVSPSSLAMALFCGLQSHQRIILAVFLVSNAYLVLGKCSLSSLNLQLCTCSRALGYGSMDLRVSN